MIDDTLTPCEYCGKPVPETWCSDTGVMCEEQCYIEFVEWTTAVGGGTGYYRPRTYLEWLDEFVAYHYGIEVSHLKLTQFNWYESNQNCLLTNCLDKSYLTKTY